MESTTLICGQTAEQISQLKKAHGAIFQVDIKDGDAVYTAIYKEPDAVILSAVTAISKTDEIKGVIAMYTQCVLAADEAITKRDMLKMSVANAIIEGTTKLTRSVKNL